MFCQKCGSKNDGSAAFCSNCGTPLQKVKRSSYRKWILIGIFTSLLALTSVVVFLLILWFGSEVEIREADPVPEIEENIENPIPAVIDISQVEKDKTIIIKEAMPKVFTIFTEEGSGSGFLYKKGGLIITNAHVVAGFTDVIVRNSNGKDSHGNVIGISDKYDIALIQAADYVNMEPLPIGLTESVIGSEVIALGSPQGFENSASIGYLTGIGRDIEYGFIYKNVYQIDAQIDHGSSGGPLLDAKSGYVIGINSLLYTSKSSIGFSIPMYSMIGLVDSWAESPMSNREITDLFNVYHEYVEYEDHENADSYYDDFLEEEEIGAYFDYDSLENFILLFRNYYEMALSEEDFYWIQDMLLPGSLAYTELEVYINDISGQGMSFNFTDNTILGVEISDDFAVVTTLEEFEFTSSSGDVYYYERTKDYTVINNDYGYYQIVDIFIYK